ncbi:unnamed protein product [Caenorhabditis sp. 36 PRJEB53466]|nr:unnamed protein product [Caenorhabditis sp. 36 PRJEB53466]
MFSVTCTIVSSVLCVVNFTVTVMNLESMQRHPHKNKDFFFYRLSYQRLVRASIYFILFIQYSVLAIYAVLHIQFKAVPAVRKTNRKDRLVLAAIIVLGVSFGGWILQWPVHFEQMMDMRSSV